MEFGNERVRGFTLLEMCMVLLIIAVLAGTLMPAIQGAFVENAVRDDSRQLALMVKTAMLQSTDQHRPYEIDLSAKEMDLHPVPDPAADPSAPSDSSATAEPDAVAPEDVAMTQQLDAANKLMVPDPKKANVWMAMPATTWLFKPGDLCPATRVRIARGDSWVEMSFNALTGNVENEGAYFP